VLARLLGLLFQLGHFGVHLRVALLRHALDQGGQLGETAGQVRGHGRAAARGRAHDRVAQAPLQHPDLLERAAGVARGLNVQLLARGAEALIRVRYSRGASDREHVVQARRALERGDLPEQRLAGTRAGDALDDDLWPVSARSRICSTAVRMATRSGTAINARPTSMSPVMTWGAPIA